MKVNEHSSGAPKVRNMTSNRTGRPVPNQFMVYDDCGAVFLQSYKSVIAKIDPDGQVTLDPVYWDYSVTTGKYRNQFLGETKKETLAKIESGEYVLADLNDYR